MGAIKKFNPETGKWEVYGSTDAKDINLLDLGDNFENKNVEGALREISKKINKTLENVTAQQNAINEHAESLAQHSSDIEWLKQYGGGGGGGGGGGAAAPTITSTFENCSIDKETELRIPIFFSSPNLGEGTAYVIINNIEVASIPKIKQGNNTIEIGKLTEQVNEISIYVKDRVNLLSNQLTWTVKMGGIDLTIDFDDTADYYMGELVTMQYYISSTSEDKMTMYMTIDYDDYEVPCKNGYNEYEFPQLGVGIHTVSLYVTDGNYTTAVKKFNVIIVNSVSLYVSSMFIEGSEHQLGVPVQVQYRISKASNEHFDVKLYINDRLSKTLDCTPGTYYWTLNDLDVGSYSIRIEVSGAYDETQILEYTFFVVTSGYQPIKISEDGLIYRLNAKGRTNQDTDREFPIDDSGKGTKTQLHNFNWFSNGWIDGELVCDGEAYVEIDLFPYQDNALYGSTIEICYTALDIGKTDARILDYTDIETPFKGAYVDIQDAALKSLANTGQIYTDRDVEITVSFVIDRKNKFGKVYIDGICSRAFSLSDSGAGVNATREDFTHVQKIFLNSKKGESCFGACKIKDLRVYNRVLSDDEIVANFIGQIKDLREQEKMYNFNFNNTTLPVIRMYGDTTNMTLETPVAMRIKYTSPNEDKFGQSFDLPYCQVNWQGTSSLQYVLKNFTARLKDETMAVFNYTPYVNGVLEDTYCFKCDYMESTHSRNVGIAKFVNDCLYDTKNPMQQKNPDIRNSVNGFPCIMYINDELQGIYNFNLDRYSTKSFGYTDPDNVLVYEISANSDTTAGAFFSWNESTGKDENAYYQSDFECLYPPTRAAGNDNLEELKRLIRWVDTSSDEDFRDNISRYFNVEYLLRYYLFVLIFGAVDSLGKNAKIASFDGGMTWYFQVYDADTTIGLNNSGFLLFDTDVEMGDENVFNTTGSRLWARIVEHFQPQLKEQYALMRQGRFTVDNIMKYLYGEQISQIPATYYNKDMQKKYLDFGSAYLYALHGSGEKHIKRWIRDRLMYVDTLLGYMVSSSDYITLRSNKLGYVYLDVEMYIPMYVTVKWRDEAGGTGIQTKRVGKGEKVRFEYNMPTETDQEILVYAGHYIKSLGNISNLQPSTLLIANADRLTEIECHSPNLINTDLSECTLLQRIDISDCTILGTGIGAQPILNIQKAKYLRYLDARNTQLTAIYTMQSGSNLEEIYYPKSIQAVDLMNQAYLRIVGIPYELDEKGKPVYCPNLADVTLNNCKNIEYMSYPYIEGQYANLDSIRQVQNLNLIESLDKLTSISFNGFNKLKTLTLSTMHNITELKFDDMLNLMETASLESIKASDCPLITKVSFNVSNASYKAEFVEGATIDLGGMQSVKTIESNASIKGLKTLIIPLSTKELKFVPGFGDGSNSIVNIWSASANHANDKYEGMDLQDVSLEYLDMERLISVERAINFHIAPTEQPPNMNTARTEKFFKPEGSINLTNYTGTMVNLLKGVDLALLDIIIEQDQKHDDLTGLFKNADIAADQADKVNNILSRYKKSTNWSELFKDANIDLEPEDIEIPGEYSLRTMNLTSMFENTKVSKDIVIEDNMKNVTAMFKNCLNMKQYKNNWNNKYTSGMVTDECYSFTGGDLEKIPVPWGGYGFFDDVTSEIIVNITKFEYDLQLADKNKSIDFGIVDWGDGTINCMNNTSYRHKYEEPGVYRIKGHFTFGKGSTPAASLNGVLTEVVRVAKSSQDLTGAFRYCSQLKKVNISGLTLTGIADAFRACSSLEVVNLKDVNTEQVKSLNNLFQDCTKITSIDMSSFTSEECTGMSATFKNCQALVDLNIENLTSPKATSLAEMFCDCRSLSSLDLSKFKTTNVTDMNSIFSRCTKLTSLDISNFDTSNVLNMSYMFNECYILPEIDVSKFNTSKCTNMAYMFRHCKTVQSLDVSRFDTRKCASLYAMFNNCMKLQTVDVSGFDLESCASIDYMFRDCNELLQADVSKWKTSGLTSMVHIFYNCHKLQSLNVRDWDTSNVTNMEYLFANCYEVKSLDVSKWDTSNVTSMLCLFANCKLLTSLNVSSFDTRKVTDMQSLFLGCQSLTSLNINNFITTKVTNFSHMFSTCINLESISMEKLTTDAATTMQYMFGVCNKLKNVDVSKFKTSNVVDMSHMFSRCFELTSLNLSHFDTSKVTDMRSMFYQCKGLASLNLSTWDTSKVKYFSYMFSLCQALPSLNIGHFKTGSAVDMQYMFSGCYSLQTVNVKNWDVSNVTDFQCMFDVCNKMTTLDVSSWNTSSAVNMYGMFYCCTAKNINVENFSFTKCTDITYMLANIGASNIKLTNKITPVLKKAYGLFCTYYGASLDMSGFDLSNSLNNDGFITWGPNLVDFKPPANITTSIGVNAEKLSVDSLIALINNLVPSPKHTQTLNIGAKNIAKLTEEQLAVAISKNWSVC